MEDGVEFVRFSLSGGRYRSPGLPVDALGEFASYQRLILDVARAQFHLENPKRQRVPRNFSDALRLRLTGVLEGSVVSVLERAATPEAALIQVDPFIAARDIVNDFIAAIGRDEPVDSFPPDALEGFNRFGASLRGDEKLELRVGGETKAVYTQEVRRRIAQLTSEELRLEDQLEGFVIELDAKSGRFHFQVGERSVPGRFAESMFESLRRVLSRPDDRSDPVQLLALYRVNETQDITFIEDVVAVAESGDHSHPRERRLEELLALEAGWLDGEGEAIDPAAVEWARVLWLRISEAGLGEPGLFPTPQGGVQIEWKRGEVVFALEYDAEQGTIDLDRTNLTTKDFESATFDATDSLEALIEKLENS